jgi:hypothetical protein
MRDDIVDLIAPHPADELVAEGPAPDRFLRRSLPLQLFDNVAGALCVDRGRLLDGSQFLGNGGGHWGTASFAW